jgi:hypothetical protein
MHRDSTPEAQALASSVSLVLYEYFEGHLPEARLFEELSALLNDVRATIVVGNVSRAFAMQANSSSRQELRPLALLA